MVTVDQAGHHTVVMVETVTGITERLILLTGIIVTVRIIVTAIITRIAERCKLTLHQTVSAMRQIWREDVYFPARIGGALEVAKLHVRVLLTLIITTILIITD